VARFLFVNQFYWPDVASTGQHLTDLCEALAARGHAVRVVCSRGGYLDGRGEAQRFEKHNGVEIVRVDAAKRGKNAALWRRALDYLSFHTKVVWALFDAQRADVVVTLTTPPLLGVWGRVLQVLRGARHVHWVMDLHPDAEFELGLVKRTSLFGRVLAFLCAHPMRRADVNVVLGPYQGARVRAHGVAAERIREIPVWSSADEVSPLDHRFNPLRCKFGWSERFVVLYSGNAGLVHRFDELLDAARLLEKRAPKVLFAFVGGGPRTASIEAYVREHGLSNVEFKGYLPREALRHSLPAGDVHFVSLEPAQTGVAVPGKLYGIFAAGRPVLFVGAAACESADAIRAAGAGATIEPGEAARLADEIERLAKDTAAGGALVRELGARARVAFLDSYERAVCCEQWAVLLEAVAGGTSATPAQRDVA
jgi:colanic acid biosynthesis glycosyl transferase WcaI